MYVECVYCGKRHDEDEFRYTGCCGEVHCEPAEDNEVHFVWTNPNACEHHDAIRQVTFNAAEVTCSACKANATKVSP